MTKTIRMKLRGEKPASVAQGLTRSKVLEMLKRPTPYEVQATGFWLERKRQHDQNRAA